MKFSAQCKKCGGWADYVGFVSMPEMSIFACPKCDAQSWFDGPPQKLRKPGMQAQPEQQAEAKSKLEK